jgi:hypothetical protein
MFKSRFNISEEEIDYEAFILLNDNDLGKSLGV